MLGFLFFPIIISKEIIKYVIDDVIDTGIEKASWEGIGTAVNEVNERAKRYICTVIIINIILGGISMLALLFVPRNTTYYTLIICTIILGCSIIRLWRGLVNLVKNQLFKKLKFLVKHRCNLKNMLYDTIYSEALEKIKLELEFSNVKRLVICFRNFFSFKKTSPEEIAEEIAERTVEITYKNVCVQLIVFIIVMAVYFLFFHFGLLQRLRKNAIELSFFQANFFPICFGVDYFFHTNLIELFF